MNREADAPTQIALMSALLDLDIPVEWTEEVAAHLKVTASHAAVVLEQVIADEVEAAPVFTA